MGLTGPPELVARMLDGDATVEVAQEDDGGGYVVLDVTTIVGSFNITVDASFREETPPGGMDPGHREGTI